MESSSWGTAAVPLSPGPHASPQPCGLCLSYCIHHTQGCPSTLLHIQVPEAESWASLNPQGPLGLGLEGPAQPVPAGFLPSQLAPAPEWAPASSLLPLLQPHWSRSLGLSTTSVLGLHSPESWRLLPASAYPAGPSHSCLFLGGDGRHLLPKPKSGCPSRNATSLQELTLPYPHHLAGLLSCLSPPTLTMGGWLITQPSTK